MCGESGDKLPHKGHDAATEGHLPVGPWPGSELCSSAPFESRLGADIMSPGELRPHRAETLEVGTREPMPRHQLHRVTVRSSPEFACHGHRHEAGPFVVTNQKGHCM